MKKENIVIGKSIVVPVIALFLLVLSTQPASAHDGQPPAPHDLWSAWNWDPIIILSLMISGWVYAERFQKLRQRAGYRHSEPWRTISFAAGLVTLFLALISPLDGLSTALFSAHMVQHMLLIVVAPLLLVLGIDSSPASFLLAFDAPVQRTLGRYWHMIRRLKPAWRALTQPIVVWALNVLVLWVWHTPRLYQAALENEALHMLEHLGFLVTSLLFWWTVFRPGAHLGHGNLGILALFTMALQGGLLGALIIFAHTPWYTVYASTTQPWGLSPLEDQQLAGAIMWVPVGTIYMLAALVLFMLRLTGIERLANQREGARLGNVNDH